MEEVETGLPDQGAGVMDPYPISWATRAGSTIYTAHIPIREDSSLELGDIKAQSRQTFQNLRQAVEAAGGSLADVVQVIVYLTDMKEVDAMNEVWAEFFAPPYPNRAAIGIATLYHPQLKIEIVAIAVVET